MRLEVLGPEAAEEWDAYVASRSEAGFYHLWAWRLAVGTAYPARHIYLASRCSDRRIDGVLPLFVLRGLSGSIRFISLPHAPLAGPLADTPEIEARLVAEAVRLAEDAGGSLELRHGPRSGPDPNWPGLSTYRLALPDNSDVLWGSLRPEIRNRTRKAEKAGVVVTAGAGELDALFPIYARHMRDLGTPPHGRVFFDALVAAAPDRVAVTVARLEGRPVAGMVRVSLGTVDTAVWVSSLSSHHGVSPVNLLYWHALREAVARGATLFDFGRGSPGTGPTVFKQRFGAKPYPLTRQCWPGPCPDPPAAGIASRAWRHLPVWLSTVVGRRLRRFIP